jgi:hypothetical protein
MRNSKDTYCLKTRVGQHDLTLADRCRIALKNCVNILRENFTQFRNVFQKFERNVFNLFSKFRLFLTVFSFLRSLPAKNQFYELLEAVENRDRLLSNNMR